MNDDQTNGRQMTNDDAQSSESAQVDSNTDPDTANDADVADEQDEIAALEQEIEQLETERDELNDRLVRKAADFKNFRRRMEREKKRRFEAGKLAVIEPMLEVLDDFERSIEAARDLAEMDEARDAYESLKGGVEMVFRKFRDELHSFGVEPIDAEGKPFDETLHEAMMRQPTDEAEPGTVLQEIRKGYTMGDRVIRHSRVVVAAEPPSDDASSGEEPSDSNDS